MSLLKKIVGGVKSIISSPAVRAVAPILGGPVGVAISTMGTAYGAYQALKTPAAIPHSTASGGVSSMGMLPSLSGMGRLLPGAGAVAGAVGVGIRGAKTLYRSAASYCRKHPGWCQTIGGIAAVEAMIARGELPPIKSRRGKGISATELKNFRRVARFTSKYCAPVRRAMSSRAVRKGARCN